MGKVGNIMAVALTSAAIGAVAGVLLAPDEGARTRKKIVKQSKKLMGTVNNHIDDGKETLEDMKEVLQTQLNRVNKKIEELI